MKMNNFYIEYQNKIILEIKKNIHVIKQNNFELD